MAVSGQIPLTANSRRAASVDQAVHALGTSSWILVTDGSGKVTFIDGRHTLRGGRSTSEMPNPVPKCQTSRKVTFARRLRDQQPLLDFGAARDLAVPSFMADPALLKCASAALS